MVWQASTILVDLGSFLTRAVSIFKSTAGDEYRTRDRTAAVLRSLLQALLTPGLNPDIDTICRNRLGLPTTQASVGFHRSCSCPPPIAGVSTLTSVIQESGKLRDCDRKPTERLVHFRRSICLQGASSHSLLAWFDTLRKWVTGIRRR